MNFVVSIVLFVTTFQSTSAVSFRGHNGNHLSGHDEHRQLMGNMGGSSGAGGMGSGGGGMGGGTVSGGTVSGGTTGGGGMGGMGGNGGGMMSGFLSPALIAAPRPSPVTLVTEAPMVSTPAPVVDTPAPVM